MMIKTTTHTTIANITPILKLLLLSDREDDGVGNKDVVAITVVVILE